MGTKPPYWIEQLAAKGYMLHHPRKPDKPLSIDEMLLFVAEYAQHLEQVSLRGLIYCPNGCPDSDECWCCCVKLQIAIREG